MLMFLFDINMKRFGICFKKTTCFDDSESTISFERDNIFIHGALSDLKLCRMCSFT